MLRRLTDFGFTVSQDPELIRPADEPIIWGSTSKIRARTAWKPTIPLEQTLSDMLAYWRQML